MYVIVAIALAAATIHTASITYANARANEARQRQIRQNVVEPLGSYFDVLGSTNIAGARGW